MHARRASYRRSCLTHQSAALWQSDPHTPFSSASTGQTTSLSWPCRPRMQPAPPAQRHPCCPVACRRCLLAPTPPCTPPTRHPKKQPEAKAISNRSLSKGGSMWVWLKKRALTTSRGVLHQCGAAGSERARCSSSRKCSEKHSARESLRMSVRAVISYMSNSRPITTENWSYEVWCVSACGKHKCVAAAAAAATTHLQL